MLGVVVIVGVSEGVAERVAPGLGVNSSRLMAAGEQPPVSSNPNNITDARASLITRMGVKDTGFTMRYAHYSMSRRMR